MPFRGIGGLEILSLDRSKGDATGNASAPDCLEDWFKDRLCFYCR